MVILSSANYLDISEDADPPKWHQKIAFWLKNDTDNPAHTDPLFTSLFTSVYFIDIDL